MSVTKGISRMTKLQFYEFRDYLQECGFTQPTIRDYMRYINEVEDAGFDLMTVTVYELSKKWPWKAVRYRICAVRKYHAFINGEKAERKRHYKKKAKLDKIGIYCMKLIRENEKMSVADLRGVCEREFPMYKIGRCTIGYALNEYIRRGIITRWETNNRLVYGFESSKEVKRCVMCNKAMDRRGPDYCARCEPIAVSIANQCFPCPIPADNGGD